MSCLTATKHHLPGCYNTVDNTQVLSNKILEHILSDYFNTFASLPEYSSKVEIDVNHAKMLQHVKTQVLPDCSNTSAALHLNTRTVKLQYT